MQNATCVICNHPPTSQSQPCSQCGFWNTTAPTSDPVLYHNQILLAKKLRNLEQTAQKAPLEATSRKPSRVILASLIKPVQFVIEKIDLSKYITNFSSYLQGNVEKKLGSIAERISQQPAIRLAAQKQTLKGPTFRDLNGPLSYLPIQEIFDRQRELLNTVLEEEKRKVDQQLKKDADKIRKRPKQ